MHFRILIVLSLLVIQSKAQNNYTDSDLRNKSVTLCRFLNKNHYKPIQWNDSSSLLLYNRWIDLLDNHKRFFTQAEIESLSAFKYTLDDELQGKSWGFYNRTTSVFLNRIDQLDSALRSFLSKPIDISKPDVIEYPYKTYAASEKQLFQRWQQYAKWQILKEIVNDIEDDSTVKINTAKPPANFSVLEAKERNDLSKSFAKRFRKIKALGTRMEDYFLNAITWCYDPHSNYMNLNAKKEFETELSGFEFSAGLNVKQTEKGDYEIDKLTPGGVAWRSGNLFAGDIIIKVKKGNEEEKKIEDMSVAELNGLLQGNSNEKVELTVKGKNGIEKKVILAKEKIEDDEEIVKSYVIKGKNNIGYIKLPGFYSSEFEPKEDDDFRHDGCANDVSKEIIKLKRDSIAGLILDLRDNGGGNMWESMQLAGIFIDIGVLGSIKDKDQKVFFLKDPNRGSIYDGPLMILVNGQSASASEFTSAMMQDYHRALIVGSTTYGKGTAQEVLPMDTTLDLKKDFDEKKYADFVKVTNEKFYRVDGTTTQWTGVIPDITLPQIEAEDEDDEDYSGKERSNPTALLPDKSKPAFYIPNSAIDISRLKTKSEERIKKDSAFMMISKLNDMIKANANAFTSIPLQWTPYISFRNKQEAFFAFIKEDIFTPTVKMTVKNNTFNEEKYRFVSDDDREMVNENLQDIADDIYVAEAMQIMQDWLGN